MTARPVPDHDHGASGLVTDAAVEAAARAIWHVDGSPKPWRDLTDVDRDYFEEQARAGLEAAAPHIAADAWDEGYLRGVLDQESELDQADNPYRDDLRAALDGGRHDQGRATADDRNGGEG